MGGFKNEKAWDHMESDSGVSTPRGGLTELKNPAIVNNSRNRTPEAAYHVDDRVSEQTGFFFEDHTPAAPRYSPPSKRTIMDKWAALGDRRRGQQTPQKSANRLRTLLSEAEQAAGNAVSIWARTMRMTALFGNARSPGVLRKIGANTQIILVMTLAI